MCIDLNRHEDRKMLKDIIAEVTNPLLSDINLKLNNLKTEVNYIKEQTTETNGKVKEHQEILNEIKKEEEIHLIKHQHEQNSRVLTCPHSGTIKKLQEKNSFNVKTKQLIVGALGTILLVLTITLTTMKVYDSVSSNPEKEKIDKIINMLEQNGLDLDIG